MLGTPEGINRHIKHNITSSTGIQSLVLSGELLYFVFLPQFKSQQLEVNVFEDGVGSQKEYPRAFHAEGTDSVSMCNNFKKMKIIILKNAVVK